MGNIKETIVHPFHQSYFQFAYNSFLKCKDANLNIVNRNVVETIHYSYSCIESFIEYLLFSYQNNNLELKYHDNWITRYAELEWDRLSLSNKIGFITYLYTSNSFWHNDGEYQLFSELRNIRNRLTHAYPHISGRMIKVTDEQSKTDGSVYRQAEVVSEGPLSKKGNIIKPPKSIVKFNIVNELDFSDAEKAFEILLYHLIRIEKIFLRGSTTDIAVLSDKEHNLIHARKLLSYITCTLSQYWESD